MNPRTKILFFSSIGVSLWCLNAYALRYLTDEIGVLGIYWPHRSWLYFHIGAGIASLLLGPVLLWLRLEKTSKIAHQLASVAYVMAGMIGCGSAIYLAAHTAYGLVVGLGFTSMAIAWFITLAFAAIAGIRGLSEQHREWLIRSYVLTFGFVFYRAGCEIFSIWGHATFIEQMGAACWISWSLPLMITEAFLQGRKLLGPAPKPEPNESWLSLANQLQDLN